MLLIRKSKNIQSLIEKIIKSSVKRSRSSHQSLLQIKPDTIWLPSILSTPVWRHKGHYRLVACSPHRNLRGASSVRQLHRVNISREGFSKRQKRSMKLSFLMLSRVKPRPTSRRCKQATQSIQSLRLKRQVSTSPSSRRSSRTGASGSLPQRSKVLNSVVEIERAIYGPVRRKSSIKQCIPTKSISMMIGKSLRFLNKRVTRREKRSSQKKSWIDQCP